MVDIEQKIKELIAKISGNNIEDIHLDSTYNSLELDSLDQVEIVINIENEFKISIDDSEFWKCKTVKDIVDLTRKKI